MSENWATIADFPGYAVSDHGTVYSRLRGHMMALTRNHAGVVKVNLMKDGKMFTRSVKVLVAEAFIEKPNMYEFEFDTPINLDGNPENNHATNIMWRPRWFAWKYTRQFSEPIPSEFKIPVYNLHTGEEYRSSIEAAIYDGLLWERVYNSTGTERPVFPTGAVYRLAGFDY